MCVDRFQRTAKTRALNYCLCIGCACSDSEFECAQQLYGVKCIDKSNRCDGFVDCADNSDEVLCDVCKYTEFLNMIK